MAASRTALGELAVNAVYAIELCTGEIHYWQYLGPDSRGLVWWLDVETGQEFNETSRMYAWSIKGLHRDGGPLAQEPAG